MILSFLKENAKQVLYGIVKILFYYKYYIQCFRPSALVKAEQ